MNPNRELLDREIGPPPPFPLSIDTLIVRQRRRARLRRAGFGGIAAAAVTAVLVLLPGALGPQPDHQTQASPSPTATVPDLRATEAARLTGALRQLVSQALPGATLARTPAAQSEPLVFADHGTHFAASAVVTDPAGTGTLRVSSGKEQTQFRDERACMQGPYPQDVVFDCNVIPGPDGSIIMRLTTDIGTEQFRRFLVEIIKADGSAVSVEVSNGVSENDQPYRGRRPQPLLTMDQAVAWVQEPSLATSAG
jgi:hypothetical protein